MPERITEITDEIFDKVKGKVFVLRTSYQIRVFQVVAKTKCYVKLRKVAFTTEYDEIFNAAHTIDWNWLELNPPTRGQHLEDRYSLLYDEQLDEYYLSRQQKGQPLEFLAPAQPGQVFTTVEY